MQAPTAPKSPKKLKIKSNLEGNDVTATLNRDEKRVVVYVEIGENLQKVLEQAISSAYQNQENIGDVVEQMGIDIKNMVENAVTMESNSYRSVKK